MNGELPKLETKLWNIFSKYIRMRDANRVNGFCICITCSAPFFWKYMEAGHYVSRNRKEIMFNEKNVNAQCVLCNHTDDGWHEKYAAALDKKFGPGTSEELDNIHVSFFRFSRYFLESKIEFYRKEVIRLKKIIPQEAW